jgi:hypothetical protein
MKEQQVQQQMGPGYPRVVGGYVAGYHPGVGYVAGVAPPAPPAPPMLPAFHPAMPAPGFPAGYPMMQHPAYPVDPHAVALHGHTAPWRPMNAPGNPPLGEGHVPLPLNPETFNGVWGAGGAATSASITFSARPQKPFKTTRVLVGFSKTSGAGAAHLVGQAFVGTDLQQGEVGNIDLETLGAGTAFDTWVSFKQAEPGVWVRLICSLLGAPTFTATTDAATYTLTAVGHYLH